MHAHWMRKALQKKLLHLLRKLKSFLIAVHINRNRLFIYISVKTPNTKQTLQVEAFSGLQCLFVDLYRQIINISKPVTFYTHLILEGID